MFEKIFNLDFSNTRSFGCIVYELFNLEKLFYHRNLQKLTDSIRNFDVQTKLKTNNIDSSLFVRVLKKYFIFVLNQQGFEPTSLLKFKIYFFSFKMKIFENRN